MRYVHASQTGYEVAFDDKHIACMHDGMRSCVLWYDIVSVALLAVGWSGG